MNFIKRFFVLLAIAILGSCSDKESNGKEIVFSCIKCKGCVENNLAYIKDRQLDKSYKIVLDTSCYEDQKGLTSGLELLHMDNAEIEKQYGHFGNFLLIDSTGKKTEFMTDMNLRDFIK